MPERTPDILTRFAAVSEFRKGQGKRHHIPTVLVQRQRNYGT